jgi:phenylacetate-CoA ligase
MSLMQTFFLWRQFERQQWLTRERVEELQRARLHALLRWAYESVPYYHGLFREHGIRNLEDFGRIPVLRKEDAQSAGRQLRSRRIAEKKMSYGSTTGSTGIPLTVGHDALSRAAGRAVLLRAFRTHGLRLTDTILRVTHRKRERALHEYLGILPIKTVQVFARPEQLAAAARRVKPDVVDAYPSVLQAMAHARVPLPRSVHHVFSTTELLTKALRRRIAHAFNAPVADLYGAAEFPSVAWECPSGEGYHIDSDYAVVECLADGEPVQPGEAGELVITGLYNCGMPLLRYALGDTAVVSGEACSCGRGLPLLECIEGRSDDMLVMPDGERVSPRRVNVLDGIVGVRQYRIVQTRKDRIVVEVVPDGCWTPAIEQDVVVRVSQGLTGHSVEVSARPVSSIPRGPGGKLRTVVSRVSD